MFDFMNHGMTLFHGFGMFIFWAIVVFLIFSCFKNDSCGTKKETPLNILKKRFAKGEISKEEYESRRKTLEETE